MVETLKGMQVWIDEFGEYHFLSPGATPTSAGWEKVGEMHPHMEYASDPGPAGASLTQKGD